MKLFTTNKLVSKAVRLQAVPLDCKGFVRSLEFFKKSWNLPSSFLDLEKVWKMMLYKWIFFFVVVKSYSISCFRKKSGKSLQFWIQKSVRTLIVMRVSMLSACERGLPSFDLMHWKGTAYLLSTSLLVHSIKKRDWTMVLITIKQFILKILEVRHVCELVLQLKCTRIK